MKTFFFTLILILLTSVMFGQEVKYQLSSHILDITKGAPANGVSIKLDKMNADKSWSFVDEKITDENGRVPNFLKVDESNPGIYKLTFLINDYMENAEVESFYPFVEVVFEIKDLKHYHVPITLSPYGYSTYRGN